MNGSDLNRNYKFRTEYYFKRGWEIFSQDIWGFIGFFIFCIVFAAIASRLPYPLGVNEERQGGLLNGLISPVFLAGFYSVALKIAKHRPKKFSDFFGEFKNTLNIWLVNYIGSFLTVIGLFLFLIPGIYLGICYIFALVFVIEKRLAVWSALEASRKVVSKKWFSFFGFFILLFLLNLGGLLFLVIGLVVTIPLTYCIVTAAYEDIVGLEEV